MHRVKFLIIKPTGFTNFSNLFLEWNSTCFGQFLCPSSGVLYCTHSNGICHTNLLTASEQDQDGTVFYPDPARKLSENLYDIYHCCVYSKKTPEDGQRNCPKHVEFYSNNKFEKLVHPVGFIIKKTRELFCTQRWLLSMLNTPTCIKHSSLSWYLVGRASQYNFFIITNLIKKFLVFSNANLDIWLAVRHSITFFIITITATYF